MKCTFSTDITETLSCSPDGEFDFNGFPIHKCLLFPCGKYKKMVEDSEEFRKNWEEEYRKNLENKIQK